FTDKNSGEVERYLAALSREIELVSKLPVMGGRPFRFVYFGGGTPSFLSSRQLERLVERLRANVSWDAAEEVTFECEPGTLDELKTAGYSVSSAYTMVKNPKRVNFSYRDNLWQGSDLLATGIASFGHISGVHYQNHPEWEQYCSALEGGKLPLSRGLRLSQHQ